MSEVLVIGNGGREHALAHAMEASPEVSRVEMSGRPDDGLELFAGSADKPFIVIGPEQPLVDGLADHLREDGYVVFGVNQQAAQYEGSKSLTTKMARDANILHPDTYIAEGPSMADAARYYVKRHDPSKMVIKADGLKAGKGVFLPSSAEEASEIVDELISGKLFGSGEGIINFQNREQGPEISAMVVVGEGKDNFAILPLAQDHKRLKDGDEGPNTGGMGSYAPVPRTIVSDAQMQKIYQKAYDSLVGMEKDGRPFSQGVLYMGLMMAEGLEDDDKDDSMLIEYNVRFGDPETQVIMPLLQVAGVDVYRLLRSAAEGKLEKPNLDISNIGYAALSVCLAAEGYPASPVKGDQIHGLDQDYDGVTIYEAGMKDQQTNGGRVLYVTGHGENINQAADMAYAAIGEDGIHFRGMQYRKDIGHQARN